jgi:co-chaperonin GroES (HSP10)
MANAVYATKTKINSKTFRVTKGTILVHGMEFKERLSRGGLILPDDDMKSSGIRPRWAEVYAVGPDIYDVKPGQYIMIAHGRWSRGQAIEDEEGEKVIRKVDPNDILLISDEPVNDYTMSDKISA